MDCRRWEVKQMGKPNMYGVNKHFIPNSQADRMKNRQFFFHGKDSAESYERISRMEDKKLRKGKAKK